jgi:hypothetical protein
VSNPNPSLGVDLLIIVPCEAPTQTAIRRSLLDAETRDLAAGNDFTLDADISPTSLIALGLDLEAEKYVYIFP